MTWTVKYRRGDGALATEVVEATTRADVFAQLKVRGVSPLSVIEGGIPTKAPTAGRPIPRGVLRGAIAGGLVVAFALVGWLLLRPADKPALPSPAPAAKVKITSMPQKPSTGPRKPVRDSEGTAATSSAPEVKKPVETKTEYVKRPGQLQLPNGKILTFPPPKEGETRKVYAFGHMYECDHEGNFKDLTERKLFHTAFEGNFLALATQESSFIPAFLTGLDESEVRAILSKEYVPIGDETEKELEKIKAYKDMQRAVLEYMNQGGSFDDFVNDMAQHVKTERKTRAMALREVMMLYKAGKISEAKEMAQAADILTDKKGFKPIKLPPHVVEAFENDQ